VQATYALEGAGCCALEVGPWFVYLSSFWAVHEPTLSFPGVRNVIESIAAASFARRDSPGAINYPDIATARLAIESRVRLLIAPVVEHLSFVFGSGDGEMKSDVQFYMFCAILNPYEHGKVHFLANTETFRGYVMQFFSGYFETQEVDAMLAELPQFALECVAFVGEYAPNHPENTPDKTSEHRNASIWSFWRRLDHDCCCPCLRRLAQLILSIAPSSAAAERSFSLLKLYFQSQQLVGDARGALEDYIELSVATSFATSNRKNPFHGVHAARAAPLNAPR
jgi:hypothetical protein